jgi:hypothetical protein
MVIRKIIVIKKAGDPIKDKSVSFPPLDNLYLNLLENKDKLKKNLPIISENKVPQKVPSPENSDSEEEDGSVDETPVKSKKEKDAVEKLLGDDDEDSGSDVDDEKEDDDSKGEESGSDDEADDGMNPEEREEMERKHILWQFKKLKKMWPERKELFEVSEHMDLKALKDAHEYAVKEVRIDSNLDTYRHYLIWGFNIIEYVGTQMFNIDLTGFAESQMAIKDKYDRYLIELGERNYLDWGSGLPIEVRLVGFIFIQAAVFFIMKQLTSKMTNTKFLSQTNPKRMRGPSVSDEN